MDKKLQIGLILGILAIAWFGSFMYRVKLAEEAEVYKPAKSYIASSYSDQVETTVYLKKSFMESCMEGEASYAYCDCVFDDMINKLGVDEYVKASIKLAQDNVYPDSLSQSVIKCVKKY